MGRASYWPSRPRRVLCVGRAARPPRVARVARDCWRLRRSSRRGLDGILRGKALWRTLRHAICAGQEALPQRHLDAGELRPLPRGECCRHEHPLRRDSTRGAGLHRRGILRCDPGALLAREPHRDLPSRAGSRCHAWSELLHWPWSQRLHPRGTSHAGSRLSSRAPRERFWLLFPRGP